MDPKEKPAKAYEALMGRWSRIVALDFVDWLNMPSSLRWLDVGCGTGALTSTVFERADPSEVWCIDISDDYISHLKGKMAAENCRCMVGDAQTLPSDLTDFDVTVSGLAINLVPDSAKGLSEMIRVTKPGGTVAVYVWDFANRMGMLRLLWDIAAEFDPTARELDQAHRFPICNPEPLRALFESYDLDAVKLHAFEVVTEFSSFDDYWKPLLSGQGTVSKYIVSLEPALRSTIRRRLREVLPSSESGSIALEARAWGIRGRVR